MEKKFLPGKDARFALATPQAKISFASTFLLCLSSYKPIFTPALCVIAIRSILQSLDENVERKTICYRKITKRLPLQLPKY